jgi:pimeloyl-ACP methyl ester carboxylesterase
VPSQRKQLLGRHAKMTASHRSAFRTSEGEAAFLAAYDAAMKRWPVPYNEIDVPSRFGTTHVVISGPNDAPPLALLHGYQATLTMWAPNIADFSKDFQVYAIDVMGQPGKSFPTEPIRDAADLVAWLSATLDALHLHRISLVGMSYGGWVALNYAIAAPERVDKLVLLSPGGVLPLATQFKLRGMLMVLFPTRFTVNSIMRWLGLANGSGETDPRPVLDLMYLGLKHFGIPPETLRVMPAALCDDDLRAIHVPVLLLIGANEVIYDAAKASARARRFIPDIQAELVSGSSHDMCFSQHRIVDARVLDFLKTTRTDDQDKTTDRAVA